MYHYTTAPEWSFSKGLWENTSVTDKLYTDATQASQELGIPVPNKVISLQNMGRFIPNTPTIGRPSFRFRGGGTDFINPQRVPAISRFHKYAVGAGTKGDGCEFKRGQVM